MSGIVTWTAVGLLGAAGAWARFSLGAAVAGRWPHAFPLGTFVVNLSGAFALGCVTGLGIGGDALLLAGTGLLGAYTTFSTWMLEAQRLGESVDAGSMTASETLVRGLRRSGLATAALLRGVEGFGLNRRLHAERFPDVRPTCRCSRRPSARARRCGRRWTRSTGPSPVGS